MVRSNRIGLPQLRQSGGCRAVFASYRWPGVVTKAWPIVPGALVFTSSRWPGAVTAIPIAAYWVILLRRHRIEIPRTLAV
jgi:hypothetical protein